MPASGDKQRAMGPEDGQSIVFGAITMLFVLMAVTLVYQVAVAVDRKVELQNAADAAAYSGVTAAVMCVNNIEWLNGCLVYVYNQMLVYAFDNMYFSGTTFTGEDVDSANFSDAYAQSADWIERGHGWLERIGEMQEAIANSTPRIVRDEMYNVATRNGADYVAIWPDEYLLEYFLDRNDSLNCVFQPTSNYMEIMSSTDYLLRVRRRSSGRYFEFAHHDPVYAHNGVNTRNSCSFYISGIFYPSDLYRQVRGCDVVSYTGGVARVSVLWPVADEDGVSCAEVRISSGSAPQFVYIDEETGDVPFQVATTAAGVNIVLTYILHWNDGSPYAVWEAIDARIGNTIVVSASGSMSATGSINNNKLSADFYTENGSVIVDGLSSQNASEEFFDYGAVKNRLMSQGGRYIFEKRALIGDNYPLYVEDHYYRFRNRGLRSPGGGIDPTFGRTLQGDDYATGVHINKRRAVTRILQWTTFGLGSPDYQSVDLMRLPMPIVITLDCIKYPILVGCYGEPEPSVLLFNQPRHGFLAVACARMGKSSTTSQAELSGIDQSLKVLHMPGEYVDFYDVMGYGYINVLSSASERSSRIYTTGGQGYWRGSLVPIKDVMLEEDLVSDDYSYSSSAQMVFDRLINHSPWKSSWDAEPNPEIPEIIRNNFLHPEDEIPFEYEGEEFDNALQH